MEPVKNINYKGLPIVYNDMSEAKPSDIFDLCFQSEELIKSFPPKSVYLLVNLKNLRFNSQVINKIKDTALKNKPFVKATAVYGVEGFTKSIHDIVIRHSGRKMKTVESLEEGEEWLFQASLKEKESSFLIKRVTTEFVLKK